MPRLLLNNKYWSKLKTIMMKFGIYDKPQLRQTIEGILYRLRVGNPWRDLPKEFGNWNSVYKTFNRRSHKEKLMNIFKELITQPDLEWEFIDGSIVKAHQQSGGAVKGKITAIGKSVSGNSSKIHMAVDSCGFPIDFRVTQGQVHDCKEALTWFTSLALSEFMIADKGYDSQELREKIRARGCTPVIPRKSNSKNENGHLDWYLYKLCHLVENVFARLKHFRAIATRYDKLKITFEGMLYLACAYLWLPL